MGSIEQRAGAADRRELEATPQEKPVQLSEEEQRDRQLYDAYQAELDGTASRRRSLENIRRDLEEREDYWRRAYERGGIVRSGYWDAPWHR